MDKNRLKKFAIESRKDLMKKIEDKINAFHVSEDFNKEQKGDLYILSNEKHLLNLTYEEYKKRDLLIKRIVELSLDQVIEEAAYTWFNRIIAIRYMEINDMLPLTRDNQSLGIRVLSSKDNTPDPEILKFINLMNPDLDINFRKEKYAELKDDNEKFKYVLLLVCKKLGMVIPQVFDGVTDYIDILIPDNLLNDSGFVTKVINEVPEDNYNQVEIIGWLYQYYNQAEKDRVISAKKAYKKNEIPYATQLFTPDWIVRYMVENSLGRYWIEHSENDSIANNWKYFIKDNIEKANGKLNPTEITFIDPCCGSGHILVYAFEVFYQLYLQTGYNKKDIPELILKNNLYGLDIDDRAGQLSILSVLLKAREYDRNIFNKDIIRNLHIMSIQESNTISESIIDNICKENEKEQAKYLIDNFKNAKEIGSLLILENKDYSGLKKNVCDDTTIFGIELREKLLPIIKIATILNKKYDVVVTNPPYMNSSLMSINLKHYIEKNYINVKNDVFSAFIQKNISLCLDKGYLGFMTPYVWMFIQAYQNTRKYLIERGSISSLIQFEYSALEEATVPICSFTYIKNKDNDGIYIRLSDFKGGMDIQKMKYLEIINSKNKKYMYRKKMKLFQDIPYNELIFWASDKAIKLFKNNKINNLIDPRIGLVTGDTNKFLRLWFEVNKSKIGFHYKNENDFYDRKMKWVPYQKGGPYRKWYGNNDYILNWENKGNDLINNNFEKNTGRIRSHNYNGNYAFKKAITWTKISSSNYAFRFVENGFMFDDAGPICSCENESEYIILSLFNSKVGTFYLSMLNPTLNLTPSNLLTMPFLEEKLKLKKGVITEISKNNIKISKLDWDSFEISWDFKKHPLLEFIDSMPELHDSNIQVPIPHLKKVKNNYGEECFIIDELPIRAKISDSYERWEEFTKKQFYTLKRNEEELNKIFIDIYGLQDELTPEEEDKEVTIRKADQLREIKSLISYAVGCMFGRYSLDKGGLIYAGGDFDKVYKKHKGEYGNWSGVSIANYTVLNDNGKEIDLSFEVDNDNVIPITDEAYFKDDIVERFKEFISVVYGKETLNENLDFIADTLGKKGTETSEDTIRRYFVNDFFNDHVKIYQKRPIYWLFDSGKKNGFKALIYMHRYNENLVPKIRLDYLHRMQATYEKMLDDIKYKLNTELSMTDKKEVQKRQANLNAKLQETKEYDEKIANVANQRIKIDLDDGVKANYEKFSIKNPKTDEVESILAKIK